MICSHIIWLKFIKHGFARHIKHIIELFAALNSSIKQILRLCLRRIAV